MARKTQRNLPNKQMYRFDVLDEKCTMEEDGYYSDKPYSTRASTDTSHTIHGIFQHERGDIVTDINLQVGDMAYLVYVVWSSGDSFGQDRGKYLTAIHLFDTSEKAKACADAIEAHERLYKKTRYGGNKYPKGFNPHSVNFIGNDGTDMTESAGWNGYFEHIDYVQVDRVTLLSEREVKQLKREYRIW